MNCGGSGKEGWWKGVAAREKNLASGNSPIPDSESSPSVGGGQGGGLAVVREAVVREAVRGGERGGDRR